MSQVFCSFCPDPPHMSLVSLLNGSLLLLLWASVTRLKTILMLHKESFFDVTWKGFFWVSPSRRHRPIRSEDPNVQMLVNLTQTSQHRQRQNLVLVTWRPPRNQLHPDCVFVSHMGLSSQIGGKMNGRTMWDETSPAPPPPHPHPPSCSLARGWNVPPCEASDGDIH